VIFAAGEVKRGIDSEVCQRDEKAQEQFYAARGGTGVSY
jgi:hypothetical protein